MLRLLCLLLCSAALWAGAPLKPSVPAAHSTRAAATPVLSDAAIERDIRARFARSKISTDRFEVKVQGGVAVITGRTDVMQHKGVATRMAKNAGALAVRNDVQISESARNRAAANLEKGRRAQLKRSEIPGR